MRVIEAILNVIPVIRTRTMSWKTNVKNYITQIRLRSERLGRSITP